MYWKETGKVRYKGIFKDGKLSSGDCVVYNKDGKIKYTGSMRRGLKEGQGKIFHENGSLYYKGEFLEGKIDGEDC